MRSAATQPRRSRRPANHTISRIIGFSGCPTTGDPWDTGTGAPVFTTENVVDTTVAFPTLTTTVANTMIVHALTTGQDINTAQSSGAGTNAALTGLTNRINNWSNVGSGGGIAAITGSQGHSRGGRVDHDDGDDGEREGAVHRRAERGHRRRGDSCVGDGAVTMLVWGVRRPPVPPRPRSRLVGPVRTVTPQPPTRVILVMAR